MLFSKRVDFKNEKITKIENDFTSPIYKASSPIMKNKDVVDNNTLRNNLISKDFVDNNTLQKELISKNIGVEPTVMTDEYKKESVRLESFRYWDVNFICKEKLSLTGFYFIGPNDMCKCYFCKAEIGLWEAGDNVLTEHLRWSPNCPLLRRRLTDNEPINQGQLEEVLPPASYDVCGAARSVNIRPNAYPEVSTTSPIVPTEEPSEQPTVIAPRHPNYPNFVLESDRLRSYADWPVSMKQEPKELSDAGFFYTGKGDRVKCFSCGGGLKDWDEGDEPWEQHAMWYSDCDYLKLMKGSVYIEQVAEKAKREVENSTVPQPSSSSSGSVSQVVQSPVETPEDENKKFGDGKLCKICYIKEYNTAFFPCGHVVACAKCASSVTKCPLCRESFTNVMRVYFS